MDQYTPGKCMCSAHKEKQLNNFTLFSFSPFLSFTLPLHPRDKVTKVDITMLSHPSDKVTETLIPASMYGGVESEM